MVDRGDDKKPDTYGPPGSRNHVNQWLKQQQQQYERRDYVAIRVIKVSGVTHNF